MLRSIVILVPAAVAVTLYPGQADAATVINGSCVMHAVRPVPVHPPLTPHRWHVRIGNKPSNPAGSHRCRGKIVAHGRTTQTTTWQPFTLPRWDWLGIVNVTRKVGETATACAAFGTALLVEIPSAFFSTLAAAASASGCAGGAIELASLLPAGGSNAKVRLLK